MAYRIAGSGISNFCVVSLAYYLIISHYHFIINVYTSNGVGFFRFTRYESWPTTQSVGRPNLWYQHNTYPSRYDFLSLCYIKIEECWLCWGECCKFKLIFFGQIIMFFFKTSTYAAECILILDENIKRYRFNITAICKWVKFNQNYVFPVSYVMYAY